MDLPLTAFWQWISHISHIIGAIASATAAIWLFARRERFAPAGGGIAAALALTALWSLAVVSSGAVTCVVLVAETARNLAWLFVVFQLFASDGRHQSLSPIRPVAFALVFTEVLHLAIQVAINRATLDAPLSGTSFELMILFQLLFTVGALVLLHNLYAGATGQSRLALRWPAAGLAGLWLFDLNLLTIAYVGDDWPFEIASLRGIVIAALSGLVAIGATRDREVVRLKPSRAVTFQTISLMVIALYFVAMIVVAQWLALAGGDFARLIQLVFLTAASAVALLALPSKRLRGWLRVMLSKHVFQHRYDYREEWLRFTKTVGNSGAEAQPLGERVVQAVCDIAESPGGLLLTPGDHGDLILAARWNWPEIDVPGIAFPTSSLAFFEQKSFIAALDDIRSGSEDRGEGAHVPQWLHDDTRAWALVPLIHFERLVGIVVLARPATVRRLDWEDFDLLRVAGQQLASYLAEHAGQEALAEASRFDDFHRRIAFVMHDIKNLASQLSLLARNAERHAEKEEFRTDMLVTLRNSADKLNVLLARLSRYGNGVVDGIGEVPASEVVRAVMDRFRAHPQVLLAACEDVVISANRNSLEQVLVHLVQNAIDAGDADSPVFLSLTSDGLNGRFEVVDAGCGMSPEFIRTRLFKPFMSTKSGGFGIGAFEARELVRAMRGRLEVESREGLGSRFVVRIPLAAAAGIYANLASKDQRTA